MLNVTIPGYSGATITIPVTSQSAVAIGDSAYSAILASIAAGKFQSISSTANTTVDLSAGSTSVTAIADSGTAPLTVDDASGGSTTVVSGLGGLTYLSLDTLAKAAADVLIDAGGRPSLITLGFGTGTVVVDGAATVNAIQGGDTVYASSGGAASINAGAGAVVYVEGNDTVGFYGPNARVYTRNGADLTIVGVGGPVNGTESGSVTVAAAGSFSQFRYNGTAGNVYVDAAANGRNVAGNAGAVIIDPTTANVTVFAGAGTETLYGMGDDGGLAVNSGSDLVNGGNGYFKGGTGAFGSGTNVLETSSISGAATLVGGSTVTGGSDQLYAQGSYELLVGNIDTTIMDASGGSASAGRIAGFSFTPLASARGEVLNAGWAKQVSIYGAAGGANTIVSGTGTVFATGNHGAGNVYIDGEGRTGMAGGAITISDFLVGVDKFMLNGATITTPVASAGGSSVTLADGTKVTLTNVTITSANVGSIFS